MTDERIPIAGPSITQKEVDYVTEAVRNAWYSNANIYNQRFEKAFAEYLGVKYAMTLPSCTSGLHLSLMALNVGVGDEVIVPDLTWIATSAPISYVGATPIFADVDEKTWCISAESLERCITSRTKAVIPVDLYGGIPDMDAIRRVTTKHKVAVIEDAAEGIGTVYKERKAGTFGDTAGFSFHGSKILTTGEGGMLVTNDERIYNRCQFLGDHGRSQRGKMFWNTEVGYKYKMSSLQAALGLAQLERITELVAKKREIFEWYSSELRELSGVTLNHEPPGTKNAYWMVTVIVDTKFHLQKEEIMASMSQKGIDCRPFFYPLSSIPAYEKSPQAEVARKENIHSYRISPYGLNLPCSLRITREQVRRVCGALKSTLKP